MKPSSVKLHDIRIAPPQAGDNGPEAIVQLEFEFDDPNGRIGPHVQMAVAVGYDASRTVPALLDDAVDEALRLLGAIAAVDRTEIRSMIDRSLLPRDPTL